MLRALWFMIKLAALAGVVIVLALQTGDVQIQSAGYKITVHLGASLVIVFFLMLILIRLTIWVRSIMDAPAAIKRWRRERRWREGVMALGYGLSAAAAGDSKTTAYHANKASRLLPAPSGISLFLQAQAAQLAGKDHDAQELFEKLSLRPDTAILGLRGQIIHALAHHQSEKADQLVQQGLATAPRSAWLRRAAFDLCVQQRHWTQGLSALRRLESAGDLTPADVRTYRAALFAARGLDTKSQGDLRAALRYCPDFIPACLALSSQYLARGQKRAARQVLRSAWKIAPHPELARMWMLSSPKSYNSSGAARLQWVQKLIQLRPDPEGWLMLAAEAAEQNLWGVARSALEQISHDDSDQRVFAALANCARSSGFDAHIVQKYEQLASAAPLAKTWTCSRTGQVFAHWQPLNSSGEFNTIQWAHPYDALLPHPPSIQNFLA